MRNESEFIKSTSERTLTAKAYKFVHQCVEVMANQRGINSKMPELRELKYKLIELLKSLFIDKGLSINEIKELIKNRTIINGLN